MSYFSFTGNTFVDNGIWGIMAWLNKKKPEDIVMEELQSEFEDIVNLYTANPWKKLIYYLFPNNRITNPSLSGKEKEGYLAYLNDLSTAINKANNDGTCISCGKRGVVALAKRNDIPLTGSGNFRNYFSYAQEGADYCPLCTLAIQFLPLMLYVCGKKVILVSSDSTKVMRRWSRKCVEIVRKQILTKRYKLGINENYTLPQNSLFHIAGDLILEQDASEFSGEKVAIRIYYFTNYIDSPDMEIFDLPSNVFSYLVYLKQLAQYNKWFEVINRGFIRKTDEGEKKFKKNKNTVYQDLLNNRSIAGYFKDKNRNIYGSWKILRLYLKEVRGMDERRIELIKELSDKIAEYIKENDKIRRLENLEMASSYTEFMNVLRLIAKDKLKLKEKDPLITLNDYVEIIYKDNYPNWKEVRDLMLFRIYEGLQQWLIEQKESDNTENEKGE